MFSKSEYEYNEKFDLKSRKVVAKTLLNHYINSKERDEKNLEKIKSLDDTLPDIYLYMLKNSNDIKLKERCLDLVDKNLLKDFNIYKKFNYKEIYFELIDFFDSINLDEPENASENFDSEEFLINGENDSEDNQSSSEIDEQNNKIILEVDFEDKNDLDENLSDNEFQKVYDKRINFDIKLILIKGENIKVDKIKEKLSQIFEACCSFIHYNNIYPDFESELFYFNCLRYMLHTYKSLKYKRFINKILLTNKIFILLYYEYSISF